MKIKAIIMILAICLAAEMSSAEGNGLQSPDQYLLVEYSDHAAKTTLKVLSANEYKALLKEIHTEARLWEKALSASEKTWETGRNKEPFPKSSIHQKNVSIIESFTNEAAAIAILDLRERIAGAGKEESKKKTKRPKSSNSSSSCSSTFSISQFFKKAQTRKIEMELRKASLQETAIRLFADKLAQITAQETGQGQPAQEISPPSDAK